jgi:hypothetical protein
MVRHALGRLLQDRTQHSEAAALYEASTRLDPQNAQAYWALGNVRALGADEWEGDPDDPNDPSHCYAHAARLQPDEFRLDGTRVRRVEPNTPEREAERERKAGERRERLLRDLKEGRQDFKYAGGEGPQLHSFR